MSDDLPKFKQIVKNIYRIKITSNISPYSLNHCAPTKINFSDLLVDLTLRFQCSSFPSNIVTI